MAPLHPGSPDEEPAADGPAADGADVDTGVDVVAGVAATIVARIDPKTTLREGESAKMHVDLAALHFFDPETGTSLR